MNKLRAVAQLDVPLAVPGPAPETPQGTTPRTGAPAARVPAPRRRSAPSARTTR